MRSALHLMLSGMMAAVMISPSCASAAAPPPSAEILPGAGYKDVTYQIDGRPVTLVNGRSETEAAPGSTTRIITRYFGSDARGDLNGDGKEDAAFLLTQDTGGSGTFYYVVVALRTATGYQGTNAILLGDRIAPQRTIIENATVVVNYAERGPDEPFSAKPSVGVSKYLKVRDGKLEEANKK
jgi:hypothetical protein